jgi:ankyrin repeat protein
MFEMGSLMAPTPLQGALHSDVEITRLLITYGANVNFRYRFGETVLHGAAENGKVEIVEELLRHGAKVNAKNASRETPLGSILSTQFFMHTDAIPVLLRNGASIRSMANWDQKPSLMEPGGWQKICRMMSMDQRGAILLGLLRMSWEHFKEIETENQWLDLTTDLHLASLQVHSKNTSLHEGIFVESLLDMDVDINAKDPMGLTALDYATIAGDVGTMRRLIKKGADIHCVDQYGMTLLHRAVLTNNAERIEVLLAEGEDINVRTNLSFEKAGSLADEANDSEPGPLRDLLQNFAAKCQLTPLQLGILAYQEEAVDTLLKHKASLELFRYPRMPAHFPAVRHSLAFFEKLIKSGAATELKDVTPSALLSVTGFEDDRIKAIFQTYPANSTIPPKLADDPTDEQEKTILDYKGQVEKRYLSVVRASPMGYVDLIHEEWTKNPPEVSEEEAARIAKVQELFSAMQPLMEAIHPIALAATESYMKQRKKK